MDDAFRRPGRPRRVEDGRGQVERPPLERERARAVRRELGERHDAITLTAEIRVVAEVAGHNRRTDRREAGTDLEEAVEALETLASVEVAVSREQQHGFDLSEAVDDAGRAEVRRGRREDRSDRVRGEERDHRLGKIRHPSGDSIARLHAVGSHARGGRRYRHPQLTPGDRAPQSVLALERDRGRRLVVGSPEQVLGQVQRGCGEEPRAGDRAVAGVERDVTTYSDDSAHVPGLAPKRIRLLHAPSVERVRVVLAGALAEAMHRRRLDSLSRRRPEGLDGHSGHYAAPERAHAYVATVSSAADLLAEAAAHPTSGWDFSWLGDRMSMSGVPWDYRVIVEAEVARATHVLDMGTGGGERLAEIRSLPERTVATEGWAPNVPVAAARLAPLGIRVVHDEGAIDNVDQVERPPHGRLAFRDAAFDVVINRHEAFAAEGGVSRPRVRWQVHHPTGRLGGRGCRRTDRASTTPRPVVRSIVRDSAARGRRVRGARGRGRDRKDHLRRCRRFRVVPPNGPVVGPGLHDRRAPPCARTTPRFGHPDRRARVALLAHRDEGDLVSTLAGEILIVTGPPGAGKSTMARALVERFDRAVLLEGDAYFQAIVRGWIAPWTPPAHDQNTVVTKAMGASAGEFARGGYAVVLEGIIGPWFLDTFVPAAGGMPVHYLIVRPTADIAMDRAIAARSPGPRRPRADRAHVRRIRIPRRVRATRPRHERPHGRRNGELGAGPRGGRRPAVVSVTAWPR